MSTHPLTYFPCVYRNPKEKAGDRTVDRFVFRCHLCEHQVRYCECIFRCGYPFCCWCVAQWFGRPEEMHMEHPRVPNLRCEREPHNAPEHPGIPEELKESKVINTMYFRPQWHYRPWRSSVVDIKRLPRV